LERPLPAIWRRKDPNRGFEVFDGGSSAKKIRLGLCYSGPIIVILDLDQHLASLTR
jgi:hypothetical protein